MCIIWKGRATVKGEWGVTVRNLEATKGGGGSVSQPRPKQPAKQQIVHHDEDKGPAEYAARRAPNLQKTEICCGFLRIAFRASDRG